MITVVNRRNGHTPGSIYAGRPGPFGNPFRLLREADRIVVLGKFKRWFKSKDKAARDMRRAALALPKDSVLECWCVPLPCHAQVIAEFVNEWRKTD